MNPGSTQLNPRPPPTGGLCPREEELAGQFEVLSTGLLSTGYCSPAAASLRFGIPPFIFRTCLSQIAQTADFAENTDDSGDSIREICVIRGKLLQAAKTVTIVLSSTSLLCSCLSTVLNIYLYILCAPRHAKRQEISADCVRSPCRTRS
jgi:hypothetical protein